MDSERLKMDSLSLSLFSLLLFIASSSSCRSFSISSAAENAVEAAALIRMSEYASPKKRGVGGKKAKCEKSFAKSIFRSNNYNTLHMFSWVQRQRQSRVVCLRARLVSLEEVYRVYPVLIRSMTLEFAMDESLIQNFPS